MNEFSKVKCAECEGDRGAVENRLFNYEFRQILDGLAVQGPVCLKSNLQPPFTSFHHLFDNEIRHLDLRLAQDVTSRV